MNKKSKKPFLIILIIVVVFTAVIYFYQKDESLSPEVRQTLAYSKLPLAPQDNAYYYLFGMFTDANAVPYTKAKAVLQTAGTAGRHQENEDFFMSDQYPDLRALKPDCGAGRVCGISDEGRLAYIKQHVDLVRNTLEQNKALLDRLRQVYSVSAYQELEYGLDVGDILKLHELALADISLQQVSGHWPVALSRLQADYRFWRMFLSSDTTLINQVLADKIVYHDLELFSDMMTECAQCVSDNIDVAKFLSPFSRNELSLRAAMGFEYRRLYKILKSVMTTKQHNAFYDGLYYSMLYKEHATLNRLYKRYARTITASECRIHDMIKCYRVLDDAQGKPLDYRSWAFWKNPVGAVLINIAYPSSRKYAWLSQRLEIYRRLLQIKHAIYSSAINADAIPGYLATLPDELKSPIAGVPVQWRNQQLKLKIQSGNDLNEALAVSL